MTILSVAAPAPLRPDPDEGSAPIATLDLSDRLTVLVTLGTWTKVAASKSGATHQGWIESSKLIEITEETVQLSDEPLATARETVTGRVDIVTSVATWTKVNVISDQGQVSTGWTESLSRPSPAQPTEGLALGVNDRYRDALLEANAITHIDAASLAALIDAEAAMIKAGPDAGAWDPRSSNSKSGAAGLTQFLASTWCEMASRARSRLNVVAGQKGLVSSNNQVLTAAKDTLLDLRFDPTLAIITAAEYGLANLNALQKDGLVSVGISDDERARFVYLAHHEGLAGAEQFLRKQGTIPLEKLVEQVGSVAANTLLMAAGGDPTVAYRTWLTKYMDQKIQPSRFRAPTTSPPPPTAGALEQVGAETIPLSLLGGRLDLVRAIQQKLTELGYLDPPADGILGPISIWALTEFCKLNGLSLAGGFALQVAKALLNPSGGLPDIRPGGDWIDRVLAFMRKQGYFVCRHPDCKNVIYLEGVDPDGTLNDQAPNEFKDLRIVFSIDKNGAPVIQKWDATTEPGAYWTLHPMDPKGAARIALGQYKSWVVGMHRPGTPGAHEALVQVAPIKVYRDLDKDYRRQGQIYTGIFGVNQHWGYNAPQNDVGNTSAGCLVGREEAGHREFMALIKTDPRYLANAAYRFVTTVMSGKEAIQGQQ